MLGIVSQSPFSAVSPHDVLEQLFLCLRLDRGRRMLPSFGSAHDHGDTYHKTRASLQSVLRAEHRMHCKGPAVAERERERQRVACSSLGCGKAADAWGRCEADRWLRPCWPELHIPGAGLAPGTNPSLRQSERERESVVLHPDPCGLPEGFCWLC